MTIKEYLKCKILKFLGLERLKENPNDARLTFISDDESIRLDDVRANKVWYIGNGNDLLNYYTEQMAKGFTDNPIYNRNKRNYFWSLSSQECDIKRIHSGIPNAIITTINNVIGMPGIEEPTGNWDKIADENDFTNKLTQQGRPLTLVEGWGSWKVNFNKDFNDYPLWEYYDAEYVEYIVKCGMIVGVIFKSYYKDKNDKNYLFIETRYKANKNSYIDYNLFKLKNANDIEEVSLDTLEELKDVPRETTVIEGLNKILAVPSIYFYDPSNPKYGRSIYAGKLDFFDMLDEIWSQASQTNRVSTPVEYYNPDVLERGSNGWTGAPKLYNRQFIEKAGVPDGDGNMSDDIITTQPDLNFDKYGALAKDVLDYILTGILSPATMGIDVAKKDNAEAQREKEKVTIMTRDNIITQETRIIRDIVTISLYMYEFMQTGKITLQDYDITVNYNEFANPSLENEIQVLGPAWSNGQISTERYAKILWADKLSEEDLLKEIQWLDSNKQSEELDMGGLFDEANANGHLQPNNQEEDIPQETQE